MARCIYLMHKTKPKISTAGQGCNMHSPHINVSDSHMVPQRWIPGYVLHHAQVQANMRKLWRVAKQKSGTVHLAVTTDIYM